jgi:hypothetical protein
MTVQDAAAPHATSAPLGTSRHPWRAAAAAAIGVYLVIALSRVVETLFYVVGSYYQDILGYLRAMLPSAAPEWFLAPLPFALMVWLGLAGIFTIRAHCTTRQVVIQSILTSLVGLVVTGLVVAGGAYLIMSQAAAPYGGPSAFSFDDVLLRFGGLYSSAVRAMTTLLTVGTLATVTAAVLLRDHLRKGVSA